MDTEKKKKKKKLVEAEARVDSNDSPKNVLVRHMPHPLRKWGER